MPTTNTHKLSLFRVGDNVEITVQYNAVFTVFERHLAALGMKFRERIDVIGVDGQPATSEILFSFPNRILPVTDGDTVQTIARNVLLNVSRAALDEDGRFLGNPDLRNDEIACSVRIQALGLPLAVTPTAFTNQKVLTFDVNAPAAIAAQA